MQRTPRQPLQVMPPVYQLLFWRWCKLDELCIIIPAVAKSAGNDFHPTPEELVRLFAALVRPNRIPVDGVQAPRKKIFRYSCDGQSFGGTEVTADNSFRDMESFSLDIGQPYPAGLYVPVGWAQDVVDAVGLGAVATIQAMGHIYGFGASGAGTRILRIEGSDGPTLTSTPTSRIE